MFLCIIIIIGILVISFFGYGIGYEKGYLSAMTQTWNVRKSRGHKLVGRCRICHYPLKEEEIYYGEDGMYLCNICYKDYKEMRKGK